MSVYQRLTYCYIFRFRVFLLPNGVITVILQSHVCSINCNASIKTRKTAVLILLFFAIGVSAQQVDSVILNSVIDLKGVFVSDVHKRSTVSNSVLNVTRISSEKIEQLGATDLSDALAFENNITISRDNALGSKGIQLMGLGGDNVKILVDGVPVIGRFFGQLDLEQFNLENIEQVEVIQGPMSVIFGSNALAGTINLVNKQSVKSGASSLFNYESDGQFNWSGTANKVCKNGGVQVSLGRTFFDGWSENKLNRSYDWIPKEQYTGGITYRLKTHRNAWMFKTAIFQARLLDKGVPMAPYGENAIDQKFKNLRLDNTLTYSRDGDAVSLEITAANNHFYRIKNKYRKDLVLLNETLVSSEEEQDTQRFNATMVRGLATIKEWKGISTVLGLDGNYEYGTGKRIVNNRQEQLDLASFISADKTWNQKWTVRVGARYAYNSAFSSPLVYSIQSKYALPKSQLIKFAYGKGFRAPSLKDLYLNFVDANHQVVGNENLKAENSHSLTGTYSKYARINKWSINASADAFANSIKNKIDMIVTSATAAKYGNIGIYQSVGGTLGFIASSDNFSIRTSYSYIGIYNGIELDKRTFFYSPQWLVQPSYMLKKTNTSFQVFYNRMGKISRVYEGENGDKIIGYQEAYGMIDFTISQRFWNGKLRTTAGIRNLAGISTLQSTQRVEGSHGSGSTSVIISPGRTFFLSIRYVFEK
jgi:outer membrane receptor for ferrienterochelin and colicins